MNAATNRRIDLRLLHGERATRLLDAVRDRASNEAFKIVSAYVGDAVRVAPLRFEPRVRAAVQESYPRAELEQLLWDLLRLYAVETRVLSRSVQLPALLVPVRERIAQSL